MEEVTVSQIEPRRILPIGSCVAFALSPDKRLFSFRNRRLTIAQSPLFRQSGGAIAFLPLEVEDAPQAEGGLGRGGIQRSIRETE